MHTQTNYKAHTIPANISYKIHPKDQRSLAIEGSDPCITSGAIYVGVPNHSNNKLKSTTSQITKNTE